MAKKGFDLSNPGDVLEIRRILEDDADEHPAEVEDFGEESDIASGDEVGYREADSETEQEDETNDDDEPALDKAFVIGKDNKTKWTMRPPSTARRTKSHNIVVHLPGVKGEAKKAKTVLECWECLFTEDILETMIKYTNQYIDTIKGRFSRERDIKHTDLIELRAFIGLLYLAGAYRGNRQSLEELWGTEGDGIEKFRLVMSIKRFKLLIRCLRFDDRTSRTQRKAYDRLAPIRKMFEMFVQNCQNSYILGENVTIDEMLPGFRGRCRFRQYIPSKPNKYGIKLFALVDAKMVYTYNMEIYAGKQPDGPFCISNKPTDVVKRMAGPLFGTGRNITGDNWFTDLDLIDELKLKKLSYVGTVRKNKRQLPASFVNVKGRKQRTSMFGFNDDKVLVSYVPKERKNVILASSLHNNDAIDANSGDLMKPEIITFYNSTKGGVDTVDKMCATYNVSRNTRRWPMVIFYACLNVAGINSMVISIGNGLETQTRRVYLKTLSHQLTVGHLARRSLNTIGIPTQLQYRMKRLAPTGNRQKSPPPPAKRRKCVTCVAEMAFRRMTNYECCNCHQAICLSHANHLCQHCSSVADFEGSANVCANDSDQD